MFASPYEVNGVLLLTMLTCCIGMSGGGEGSAGLLSYQYTQSFQHESGAAIVMTASAIEEFIASCLLSVEVADTNGDSVALDAVDDNDENCSSAEIQDEEGVDNVELVEVDDNDEEDDNNNGKVYDFNPVKYFDSEDAQFLRCWPPTNIRVSQEKLRTIFGISEFGEQLDQHQLVSVALLESIDNTIISDNNYLAACCCHHPRGNWDRNDNTFNNAQDDDVTATCNASVNIFDLTRIQDQRRGIVIKSGQPYPCFDSPGRVFHLLRSVLHNCDKSKNSQCGGGLHFASPWYQRRRGNISCNGSTDAADQNVVAILVNNPDEIQSDSVCQGDEIFWDNLEKKEINELLQFRTGDAAPSYFLHSTCQLSMDLVRRLKDLSQTGRSDSSDHVRKTMLFIYRPLPPRNVLSHNCFGQERSFVGCLWETYLEVVSDAGPRQPLTKPLSITKHRMVSPPYLSHTHEYPGVLDALLAKFETLRNEAQTIPQWTAWPEKNHYAGKVWSVFPLCYTFPANDLTQRKFIDKMCVHVPETTKLLHGLGPALRTALYSRLDSRAKLGVHTGWSDLANHVLRVHIPLVVPGSQRSQRSTSADSNTNKDSFSRGLCGTWVDGCVETHDEGSIIIFDDSKVHRAFNYSEEERIVLIIDLARPRNLPEGTASGGHSDDLDAFINGF